MVWLNPSKECAMSGCHKTVQHPERYCGVHRREGQERDKPFGGAQRYADVRLYSTKGWRKMRRAVLAKQPMCADCGSRRATHVDHIVPRKRGGTEAIENLQGLCPSCHTAKTGRGD